MSKYCEVVSEAKEESHKSHGSHIKSYRIRKSHKKSRWVIVSYMSHNGSLLLSKPRSDVEL